MEFEHQFLLFLQNHRTPWLNQLMCGITHLGDAGWFFIAITLVLLVFPKTRKYGMYSMMALLLHVLIVNLGMKNLFARMRPYDRYPDLISLIGIQKDFSFPSGHTAAAFASSLALFFTVPKKYRGWTIALLVLSALIAFSRMYVGVHYPTDIAGGVGTGVLTTGVSLWLVPKLKQLVANRTKCSSQNKNTN